jgi:hypothetical protein
VDGTGRIISVGEGNMEYIQNCCWNITGKILLGRSTNKCKDDIKKMEFGWDLIVSGSVAISCDRGNEISGSIKLGLFLDQLND